MDKEIQDLADATPLSMQTPSYRAQVDELARGQALRGTCVALVTKIAEAHRYDPSEVADLLNVYAEFMGVK